MDFNENNAFGCLVMVLFALLSVAASLAVGVLFGAGFGFLAYAAFVAFALAFSLIAFKRAK